MHLNCVCSLYEEQVREGRFFIHEHPAMATSWEEPAVRRVLKLPDVRVTRVDACQYGMTGQFHGDELPVKKPTKWMSNMKGVIETLHRTCAGRDGSCSDGRRHASCTGKRAERAAIYPIKLCKAILQGIRCHLEAIGLMHKDCIGVMTDAEDTMIDAEEDFSGYEIRFDNAVLVLDELPEHSTDDTVQNDIATSAEVMKAAAAAHRGTVDVRDRQRWDNGSAGNVKRTYDALTRQVLDEGLVRQPQQSVDGLNKVSMASTTCR